MKEEIVILVDALQRTKTFIEYARYELEDGKGSQFPGKEDADIAIKRIDDAIKFVDSPLKGEFLSCKLFEEVIKVLPVDKYDREKVGKDIVDIILKTLLLNSLPQEKI